MTKRRRMILTSRLCALLLATRFLIVGTVFAEELQGTEDEPSRISLEVGLDVASHYTFRGFSQEGSGFIGQPWAELGFNLFEGDGAIGSVDLYVGSWNSIHGNKTFAAHSPSTWYESDLYFGLTLGLPAGLEAGAGYTLYMSPSGAFDAIGEIGLTLGYAVSSPLAGFVDLTVGAGFFIEVDDAEAMENRVLELILEPSMALASAGPWALTLSLPVTAGFDLGGYYGDDTFGFVDLGAEISAPLPFMPSGYGSWEISGGVHYVRLGGEAAAASLPFIAEGRRDLVYGTMGVSMSR